MGTLNKALNGMADNLSQPNDTPGFISNGAVAGIIVGSVIGLLLIVVCVVFLCYSCRDKSNDAIPAHPPTADNKNTTDPAQHRMNRNKSG